MTNSPHQRSTVQMTAKEMTPAIDIYRIANLLIKEHGDTAAIEAAMRADAMLEKGDLDGQAVWLRVLRTVKELQETEPRSDTAVH